MPAKRPIKFKPTLPLRGGLEVNVSLVGIDGVNEESINEVSDVLLYQELEN